MIESPSEPHRIAILPLKNISPDPKDEYFTDGMTEELISTVSKIADLRVIARTSAMRYRGAGKTVAEIGAELKVTTVLEGSVRKAGNRLRIAVQLIDAPSDGQIWSADYDRDLSDVFAIQREIAERIAASLKVEIRRQEQRRLETKATTVVDAYTLYLEGRFHWNTRSREGLEKAARFFEQAIERDPRFALAYSGLADVHTALAIVEFVAPHEAFPKARLAAEKALGLDETLAEAHASLGLVHSLFDRDWAGAERELRRAIELNPNYAAAHQFYGDYLKAMGRLPEALEEMHRALELDPVSLPINTGLGHVLYLSRDYDAAIEQYRAALALDPKFAMAHLWFGRPYLEKRMFPEAIAEIRKAVELTRGSTIALAVLGHAYASAGDAPAAREILDRLLERSKLEYMPSYWIALIYTGLGDHDEAFRWLDRACEERSSWLTWIRVEPRFDGLRGDPRFAALLHRTRLDDAGIVRAPLSAGGEAEIRSFLTERTEVRLSRYRVLGDYMRYDEAARNILKDLRTQIVAGIGEASAHHDNFLLWAPPGTGKTFFVREAGRASKVPVNFVEINLAETDEAKFRSELARVGRSTEATLCLVDEADSKPSESWPFEALLPLLDDPTPHRPARVFVIAGSLGTNRPEMETRLAARPKGTDLLSRIPETNRYTLPALTPEDRILVALGTLRHAALEHGRELSEVEKLALYYIATSPQLSSARQLREFVTRCVERIPPAEERVKFDHLFAPGDPLNKEFWARTRSVAGALSGTYLRIEE